MYVFPFTLCIFAFKVGQKFCYKLKYPRDALFTQYARPEIVNAQLTLIFMMW